jgi:hypothetical protein
MMRASFVFTNSAPSSASAADAATIFKVEHVIAMLPLSWIGSPSQDVLPMKNIPRLGFGIFLLTRN